MTQIINHSKDGGLLNMIKGTAPSDYTLKVIKKLGNNIDIS